MSRFLVFALSALSVMAGCRTSNEESESKGVLTEAVDMPVVRLIKKLPLSSKMNAELKKFGYKEGANCLMLLGIADGKTDERAQYNLVRGCSDPNAQPVAVFYAVKYAKGGTAYLAMHPASDKFVASTSKGVVELLCSGITEVNCDIHIDQQGVISKVTEK